MAFGVLDERTSYDVVIAVANSFIYTLRENIPKEYANRERRSTLMRILTQDFVSALNREKLIDNKFAENLTEYVLKKLEL